MRGAVEIGGNSRRSHAGREEAKGQHEQAALDAIVAGG
jgi:hypothetical protein